MTLVSRRSVMLGAAAVAAVPVVGRSFGAHATNAIDTAEAKKLVAWDRATIPAIYPERVLGDASAPVAIIEYSSLTCPHCAHFHVETLPKLKKDFIDTGKAFLVMRDFPLDQLSLAAALIARSAPEDRFFPLLGALFAEQTVWARAENPAKALTQMAMLGGMSRESVDAAMKNTDLLQAIVDVRSDANKVYEVNSTPSFVIAGVKYAGALSYDAFADLIEKAS